jgi:hypothetical protein
MKSNDLIGSHGEFVFQALISQRCRKRFYFHPIHLGEKHATTDMKVELINPHGIRSCFYVQVKSTTRGYAGNGIDEKLNVAVKASDIQKLKQSPGPTYIAGIDIESGRGYLAGIVSSRSGAINGLPTRHPIDCHLIPMLWTEVEAYWNANPRHIPMISSAFEI